MQDENEFLDELVNPISDIMESVNNDVINVIIDMIKHTGGISNPDAHRLDMVARRKDLAKIEKIVSEGTGIAISEIDRIFIEAAAHNDDLAEIMFKAQELPGQYLQNNAELQAILKYARDNVVDGVNNLSKTISFMSDGKMTEKSKYYNTIANKALYAVQNGTVDYLTAMRKSVRELAENGVRVADFESGYHRRIDSQVRMNVLDGVRMMNMEYRKAQGEKYGADMIFISYHALCANDHQFINGQKYSFAAWEKISQTLQRPVGQMNCHHYITYGIAGVSENPISKEQRADAIKNSNQKVTYDTLQTDADGNPVQRSVSKYEFSQVQRKTETDIRRLKDIRDKYIRMGDDVMAKEYDRKARAKAKYYRAISKQGGLSPKQERLGATLPTK